MPERWRGSRRWLSRLRGRMCGFARKRLVICRPRGEMPGGASSIDITRVGARCVMNPNFHRMLAFGQALPQIRARAAQDLALRGMPRNKVLAGVVLLLESTLIRIGNDEYARANKSYGLTTMRNRHVDIDGSHVRFHFRGKSGKQHDIELSDRRLARIVQKCRDLPGQELFQYLDEDGARHALDSADVNDYLREIAGDDYTAKDFRTWAGTVLAAGELARSWPYESDAEAKRHIVAAVQAVSQRLGNTPAVCRKCYIHPVIIEAYQRGDVSGGGGSAGAAGLAAGNVAVRELEGEVLAFLRRQLEGGGAA